MEKNISIFSYQLLIKEILKNVFHNAPLHILCSLFFLIFALFVFNSQRSYSKTFINCTLDAHACQQDCSGKKSVKENQKDQNRKNVMLLFLCTADTTD